MEPEWRASGGRSQINKRQFKELLNIVVNIYECDDTLPQKNCFLPQFGKLFLIEREFSTEYSCFKKG
jgi:plasmid replication initiation protein